MPKLMDSFVGRGVRGAIMAVPLLAIMKILLAATNHPMAQGTTACLCSLGVFACAEDTVL